MLRASLALAVLATVSTLAQALPIEYSGTPAKDLAPIGTYGLDVAAKRGLKSLAPEGWGIYLHKDAVLPATISWAYADTWLSALQAFSDKSGLRIDVDWDSKSIYVKPAVIPQPDAPDLAATKPVTIGAKAGETKPVPAAPSSSVVARAPQASSKPVAPMVTLKLTEGQLMSSALGAVASEAGWTLRWESQDDFEAASSATLTGTDFRDVLEKALVRMGLSADWYPDSKVAVVSKKH